MGEFDFGQLKYGDLHEKDWSKKIEPGTAVIVLAINQSYAPPKTLDIYGLGTYEGDFIPPVSLELGGEGINIQIDDEGEIASMEVIPSSDANKQLEPVGLMPKIKLLHSGVEVWGNECWWRPLRVDRINFLEETLGRGCSIRVIDIKKERENELQKGFPNINN